MKRFSELIAAIPGGLLARTGAGDPLVNRIMLDSRQVRDGDLFVALVGGSTDGHRFIPGAVNAGASAILGSRPTSDFSALGIPYIQVEDSRQAMAYMSAALHNFPARKLTVIGVTGTDGKTTTSNLLYQVLLAAGYRAGMISTVNAVIGDQVLDTGFHVTTPEAPDVQRYLAMMVDAGLTHVVLESTSHGLAQHRVTACEFDIGVVTNITHEHLDYHGTYEAYRGAKARLFTSLEETADKPAGNIRLGVLNRDDASYEYLEQVTRARKVAYSLNAPSDLWADSIQYTPSGIQFIAHGGNFLVEVKSNLLGEYNVSNILAAMSAAIFGLGIDPKVAASGISQLAGVPGRMEKINLGQDFLAIVDFAHTPNALLRALEAARKMTRGRVLTVFGSAGLRDRQKRRMMAAVSIQYADVTYLTAEDPRTESLDAILAEMADEAQMYGGVEGTTFFRIPDRGNAIRAAVSAAKPGDLVIACGKGHEQSMCFGEVEYRWDDRIAMQAALSTRLGIVGPEMPHLPTWQETQED
ncbi:MAG TPA: UDP-N-acetylmuramoyl-L-alanyl-D-glutamate--2,6-diaminopimelate ligase [Anaerolineaceae bacterium]|nr:UDP-N-acetylmuramoyl-L-alanyl-D-glutamate--2,6-diaminopimelate ligase [Anaerolineaceae bacterium]